MMIDDENDHDAAADDDYDGCHDDGEDLIGPEEVDDDVDDAADDYDGCHDDGEDLIGPEEVDDDVDDAADDDDGQDLIGGGGG